MSEEGFLSRWSRRKRAAGAAAASEQPEASASAAPAAPAPAPASPAPESPGADAPLLPEFDPASLPPIESLSAESDFAAFLRKGVPATLQRAALRRAWSLDPAIRDFIGPADYAWDYNAPDGVPGFALDLPEDARRLAMRMLGLEREDEGAGPPAQAAVAEDAPPAALPPATPVVPAPAAAVMAEAPTVPEALPKAASEAVAPGRPAPRRHGSALPS